MQTYFRLIAKSVIPALAAITCISLLLGSFVETYFDRSFRTPITALFFFYIMAVGVQSKNLTIKTTVLIGLVCNFFYGMTYFLIGPGSYLMVQTLTICIAAPLLYNSMVIADYGVIPVWNVFKKIQLAIYCSLVAEFLLAILGYQSVLESILSQGTNRPSLVGYFNLHNSFSNYFDLGFVGLQSLALTYQAYAQFCVMLTIFGFRYFKGPFSISKFIIFIVAPITLSIVSPNVTSVVILVSIIFTVITIKAYLHTYSPIHVVIWFLTLPSLLYIVYGSDLGFIRTYDLTAFYRVYVEPQLEYVSSRSVMENLIGVDARIFEDLRRSFEIALLMYMSATGTVFFILNMSLVVYLICKNLQQIRYLRKNSLCSDDYLEAQIMNLVFVVSSLVSTIHFPVIATYIGSMVFIFNLALGFYSMHSNNKLIRASAKNSARKSVEPQGRVQTVGLISQ